VPRKRKLPAVDFSKMKMTCEQQLVRAIELKARTDAEIARRYRQMSEEKELRKRPRLEKMRLTTSST
jgi:hypothetical protein